MGGDAVLVLSFADQIEFLSTPPSWVATERALQDCLVRVVSIHATLMGGDIAVFEPEHEIDVSIHATLMGGDGRQRASAVFNKVSIHATLMGGDRGIFSCTRMRACFYPRHPHGWRRRPAERRRPPHNVSIHATLMGGDLPTMRKYCPTRRFLSTPPSWVATPHQYQCGQSESVSIHATLMGGDAYRNRPRDRDREFLSTPPSWVATGGAVCAVQRKRVSIHATLMGGDLDGCVFGHSVVVSIHATLMGGDSLPCVSLFPKISFYPRHPHGWRRSPVRRPRCRRGVSIHATLMGGDGQGSRSRGGSKVSIHATLMGGDSSWCWTVTKAFTFLSTPPSWVATRCQIRRKLDALCFYPRHPHGWRRILSPHTIF